jgi:ketosteroid isomerase-like protein
MGGCVVAGHWEDKLAIRETLERYMRYNDDGALDRLVALFAEDAVLQVMGRVLRGHEQIRGFLGAGGVFVDGRPQWTDPGQLLLQPRSAHLSANPVIDVDGGTATAETDFAVLQRDDDGRARVALVGRYRDRLRKNDDGQWVFVQRTGVSLARPGEAGTDSEWQRALARTGETVDQVERRE